MTLWHGKLKLAKTELLVLVTVKAVIFYLIWLVFFAHPVADQLSDQKLADRMLGSSAHVINSAS